MSNTVATANVYCRLPPDRAVSALLGVLDQQPDLIGLQEWGASRRRLLPAGSGYTWVAPLMGGCPVGVRLDRFEILGSRQHLLSGPGWSEWDRSPRRPRIATAVVLGDRDDQGRRWTMINHHLSPGVQRAGRYRTDRPRSVARHQQEVRRLVGLVEHALTREDLVVVTGDSNFDGLQLPGLTSAWAGREKEPGTLGTRRHVDDVFGPGRATSVRTIASASDHLAVVVVRPG